MGRPLVGKIKGICLLKEWLLNMKSYVGKHRILGLFYSTIVLILLALLIMLSYKTINFHNKTIRTEGIIKDVSVTKYAKSDGYKLLVYYENIKGERLEGLVSKTTGRSSKNTYNVGDKIELLYYKDNNQKVIIYDFGNIYLTYLGLLMFLGAFLTKSISHFRK